MKAIYAGSTQIHSNTDDLGMFVSPEVQGLDAAAIRLASFDRPNVDGAVVANQLYGSRLVTFAGKVYSSDTTTYRELRRTLVDAFKINRVDSVLYPIVLKFTTMDDLELQVEGYTRKLEMKDAYMNHANFKIDFYCPDYYVVSQTIKSEIINAFSGGGFAIPHAIPLDFNENASTISELVNEGNVDAFPEITINGPLDDPLIVNQTTGDSMSLNYTLTSGQYLVINTKDKTMLYYSAVGATPTNKRQYLSGDFIKLAPGTNQIKLSVASFDTGNAQFAWRDSYSGI